MVAVERDGSRGDRRIVLRPNIAVNWRQTLCVYGMVAATCLGVGVTFGLIGFWPVLPFAGLEVGLLGWALYSSAQRAGECEVVIVRDDRVEIQKGRRRPERCWTLDTYWTEVALERTGHRWYPGRLLLRSHGIAIELGRFLRDDERAILARQLKRWIGPMAGSGEHV
jgi:uncharacterized membrane protein